MASDLLMFYTQEFAYVSLAAEVTTGSSIMPQKRNPDVFELIRAHSATSATTTMTTSSAPTSTVRQCSAAKC